MNKIDMAIQEIRTIRIAREIEAKEKIMNEWFDKLTPLEKANVAYGFWDSATYDQKREEYEAE